MERLPRQLGTIGVKEDQKLFSHVNQSFNASRFTTAASTGLKSSVVICAARIGVHDC